MARLSPEGQLPRSGPFAELHLGKCLHENSLASAADITDWRLEGQAAVTFPSGRMRLESVVPKEERPEGELRAVVSGGLSGRRAYRV